MTDIKSLRDSFREGTNKGAFFRYKNQSFDPGQLALIEAAVSQGYDDAKRTFTGISQFWHAEKSRKDFFSFVAGQLREAFQNPPADFNSWHHKACISICQWFDAYTVTYGQAQKILNMAFKYLYCLPGAEDHSIFQKCHMPLDSFTLEWYKRYVVPADKNAPKLGYNDKWSNLNSEAYQGIAGAIASHLQKSARFDYRETTLTLPTAPLAAEFYIWTQMQMHMAAESFFFAFETMSRQEKNDWKALSLFKKLASIQACIQAYQAKPE